MKKLLLLLSIVLISACKKSSTSNVLVGVWDLQSLTINGNDSTQAAKSQQCYLKWEFHEEDKSKGVFSIYGYPTQSTCRLAGTYELPYNNHLKISFGLSSSYNPIGAYRVTGLTQTWQIISMSNSSLILDIDYNGSHNEMKLKKM